MLTEAWRPADLDEPVLDTTIGGVLRASAEAAPATVAIVDGVPDHAGRTRRTFEQLLDEAERVAAALAERFEPGERLAVWVPTRPEAMVLTYAAALAGLVQVPVNPGLRPAEVAHVLGQSGTAGVLLVGEHRGNDLPAVLDAARGLGSGLPSLREVVRVDTGWSELVASGRAGAPLPVVSPDDVAQLVYTSGTTGAPKGALLTHRGITNSGRFGALRFGMVPGDVYVDPLPTFHVGGQVVNLSIHQRGATMVMVRAFDPALVLELIESERATLTVAVPTMLVDLLEHPDLRTRDLRTLRSVSSGGAVVRADLVRKVRERTGASVTIVFGQTEACGYISQTFLDDSPDDIEQTLGVPLPAVEARVVDVGSGEVVGVDDVGELQVRGPNVMAGYHAMPEATAEALTPEGWLRTGDLVTMDARGYLRIVGRTKEMIVTGAVNVFPAEVEAVVHAHEGVAEVAVVGLPDDRWGERVVAVVRPASGPALDTAALEAFARQRLAPYKVPKEWVVVDDLPLTAYGKVRKHELLARLTGAAEEEAAP